MRKSLFRGIVILSSFSLILLGCKKNSTESSQPEAISQDVLDKIYNLGFSNKNVTRDEGDYVIEGDIRISEAELTSRPESQFLRVGSEEQYRTTNLVTGVPRVITVSLDSRLPLSYVDALDMALARYNGEGLSITFQRVTSGAAISLVKGNGNYLASAGFPSGGDPYDEVKINSRAMGNQPTETVATVIAHELGHCIGFRHTDYMNRAYSCGGQPVNEGASSIGAVLIPGTPSGPDSGSWMLSCIGSGQDRPFNNNDKTALNYLY
jgi:Dual-action HEIGH metallo-peptidase